MLEKKVSFLKGAQDYLALNVNQSEKHVHYACGQGGANQSISGDKGYAKDLKSFAIADSLHYPNSVAGVTVSPTCLGFLKAMTEYL